MKRWILLLATASLALTGCFDRAVEPETTLKTASDGLIDGKRAPAQGQVVVANRASGTISVIDARSDAVAGTYALPVDIGEPTPEPMYVVAITNRQRVIVGDRANNRVAVFNARSFAVEGTVTAGAGVFHMWADPQGRQLWVNNDIDNTTTVIDPSSLTVLATVPTPADLVAMGGKPHDVVVGPKGRYAYISVLGVAGENDYVVQYDTGTFAEIGRAAVGKDPHLSLARQHRWLYVPCQISNVVIVLDRLTLVEQTRIDVPGAHGAGMSDNGKYFYTANLPGGGAGAIYTIDTQSNTLVSGAVDSPYPVPHNLALTTSGHKLYLTHSGPTSDKVTVYQMLGDDPVPEFLAEVTVGFNPFGLAFSQ